MHPRMRLVVAIVVASAAVSTCQGWDPGYDCSAEGQTGLYEKRIAPLFEQDSPSSCNQCHLSGIDLGIWFKDTPCQTMACLHREGLVNLDSPEDSVALSWIDRADPASAGITSSVLAEEREAVLEWIRMTAECGLCDSEPNPCERDDPWDEAGGDCGSWEGDSTPFGYDDPGDCSDKTLEEVFLHGFFPWRRRCYPCHFESYADKVPEAPKWIAIGPCEIAALRTMRNVIDNGYIDVDDPANSKWILKPLDEEIGGIEHGGGPKFHASDEDGAESMLYFAERWAACQQP